jgi:hypothetical protein
VGPVLGDRDAVAGSDVGEPRVLGDAGERGDLVGAGAGLPSLRAARGLRLDRQLDAEGDGSCRLVAPHGRVSLLAFPGMAWNVIAS